MKTGDKVIVPAEINGYGRDLRAIVTEIEKLCICQGRRVKNTARAKRAQEIFYPESETSLYKCGVRSYLCAGK